MLAQARRVAEQLAKYQPHLRPPEQSLEQFGGDIFRRLRVQNFISAHELFLLENFHEHHQGDGA
jgi:hypothetical protein